MSSEVSVRPASPEDAAGCVDIVTSLPEFFTEDVPRQVARDVQRHRSWVVVRGGEVVGFAVVASRSSMAAEILWVAVAPEHRGVGMGTRLVDEVLRLLANEGMALVEVKTLDRAAEDEGYEGTRAFWERRGFVQMDTIDPLPGWQPGNPAAIYVAALKPTRP
jgi:ribosomal protein S18 acetylase RimI-like enzyme